MPRTAPLPTAIEGARGDLGSQACKRTWLPTNSVSPVSVRLAGGTWPAKLVKEHGCQHFFACAL